MPYTARVWLGGQRVEGWDDVQKVLDKQPRCDLDMLPCEMQQAYVELDGAISEAGRFGRMGRYEREVTARRFTFAARTAPDDCRQPAY